VVRLAERVTCPGIAMNLCRRVGVVITVSEIPPRRTVQRARLVDAPIDVKGSGKDFSCHRVRAALVAGMAASWRMR
jgi:hypothetical protein